MTKSSRKSVAVLKHIWDQLYRDNRTRPYIHRDWNVNNKEICSIMLKLGKHYTHKDIRKINKLVSDIRCKYQSLRKASQLTPYSWTQFRHFMSIKSVVSKQLEYSHKSSSSDIKKIEEHMNSKEISFPLPDKKYIGKKFIWTSMKNVSTCIIFVNVLNIQFHSLRCTDCYVTTMPNHSYISKKCFFICIF